MFYGFLKSLIIFEPSGRDPTAQRLSKNLYWLFYIFTHYPKNNRRGMKKYYFHRDQTGAPTAHLKDLFRCQQLIRQTLANKLITYIIAYAPSCSLTFSTENRMKKVVCFDCSCLLSMLEESVSTDIETGRKQTSKTLDSLKFCHFFW